jgi:hypothetical protein
MHRSLLIVLVVVQLVLSACLAEGPGSTDAPTDTAPPPTTEAPETTEPPTETTEAPETTEPPTETTVPAGEDDETDGEALPIWVWVLAAVVLVGLGAVLFRPRQQPSTPATAPAAAPVASIDQALKSDAYAEARWLGDRLTADLGDFKAQLDGGTVPPPPDTDARMQALAMLGERSTAAANALYQAEASATTDVARSVVRATIDAVDGVRRSFDAYVAAAAAGDPSTARTQLDTARKVLSASLESLRSL